MIFNNKNITTVGSIALDNIETRFEKKERVVGGSAIYFSIAASLFTQVHIIGIIGDDFPQEKIKMLKGRNVNTSNIITCSGKTFSWGGKYSDDFHTRETLFTNLGVFENFNPIVSNNLANKHNLLFLANIHPALQMAVLKQCPMASTVITDTMNLWIDTDLDGLLQVIKKTNILILNDEEAKQLINDTNLEKCANQIHQMGPKEVIIKLGSKGCLYSTIKEKKYIGAFKDVTVKDPTGAGDSFAGAFLGYLTKYGHEKIEDALIFGNALASYTIESIGIDVLQNITEETIMKRFLKIKKELL